MSLAGGLARGIRFFSTGPELLAGWGLMTTEIFVLWMSWDLICLLRPVGEDGVNCPRPEPWRVIKSTRPGWPDAKAVSSKPPRVGQTQKEAIREGIKRERAIFSPRAFCGGKG